MLSLSASSICSLWFPVGLTGRLAVPERGLVPTREGADFSLAMIHQVG